jgi:hypothetical protein
MTLTRNAAIIGDDGVNVVFSFSQSLNDDRSYFLIVIIYLFNGRDCNELVWMPNGQGLLLMIDDFRCSS